MLTYKFGISNHVKLNKNIFNGLPACVFGGVRFAFKITQTIFQLSVRHTLSETFCIYIEVNKYK